MVHFALFTTIGAGEWG